MATIKFSDVSRVFERDGKDFLILDNINLTVQDKEFVVIVGPSGCGKTTCMRMAAGLEFPSTGSVKVNDVLVSGPGPDRAVVFQQFALFPWKTVYDNIDFGLRGQGIAKEERESQIAHYIALMNLKGYESAYPHQLSGGMQQRVAIARALALNPEVLLLDEITSALDPELVGEVLDVVRELKGSGITLLLATHEMGFAKEISDRVCFLAEGTIAELGSAEQIFTAPTDARTQQFLQRVISAGRLRG